jgi:hypothetical protein
MIVKIYMFRMSDERLRYVAIGKDSREATSQHRRGEISPLQIAVFDPSEPKHCQPLLDKWCSNGVLAALRTCTVLESRSVVLRQTILRTVSEGEHQTSQMIGDAVSTSTATRNIF